jgi:hypothetical protein
MTSYQFEIAILIGISLCSLSFCIGYFVGVIKTAVAFQGDAVNQGKAEYNSRTGRWQWK